MQLTAETIRPIEFGEPHFRQRLPEGSGVVITPADNLPADSPIKWWVETFTPDTYLDNDARTRLGIIKSGIGLGLSAEDVRIKLTMAEEEAVLYAAQWGSAMTSGDPGACMYGFSPGALIMQSETHRERCIDWIADCRGHVVESPSDYDADELRKLDELRYMMEQAPALPGQGPTGDSALDYDDAEG